MKHPYRLEWRTRDGEATLRLWRTLASMEELRSAALDLMRSGAAPDAEFRIATPDHRPGSHHPTSGRAIAAWRPERDVLPARVPTSGWDADEKVAGKGSEVVERVRAAMNDAIGHGLIPRPEAAKVVRSVSNMLDENKEEWG